MRLEDDVRRLILHVHLNYQKIYTFKFMRIVVFIRFRFLIANDDYKLIRFENSIIARTVIF